MGSTWSYLDITALGRQEDWEDSPEGYPQSPRAEAPTVGWRNWGPYQWWNLHDEYDAPAESEADTDARAEQIERYRSAQRRSRST
jgi:Bacterial protein of unknown function (DUF899)